MIEVEKNFKVAPTDKKRLTEKALLLYKKIIADIYYDDGNYSLTGKDFWLRNRDGRFELKVPLNTGHILSRVTDQYRELETDGEIALELGLPSSRALEKTLRENGYEPFAAIVTTRERYECNDFHLDFDEMDFGFNTFEVELMVEKSEDIPVAEKRILEFGAKHRLSPVNEGKVIEYLRRYRPEHLAFLQSKNVA